MYAVRSMACLFWVVCFVVDNCDARRQCDPIKVSHVATDDTALIKTDRLFHALCFGCAVHAPTDWCTAAYSLSLPSLPHPPPVRWTHTCTHASPAASKNCHVKRSTVNNPLQQTNHWFPKNLSFSTNLYTATSLMWKRNITYILVYKSKN